MALQNTSIITKYIFVLATGIFFFFLALTAHAADSSGPAFVPLIDVPQGSILGDLSQSSMTLSDYLNNTFRFAIILGAMLAVGRLVWAGWLYMSQDAWGTKSKAKEVIKNAIIGLLLLLSVWLILYQINPCILKIDLLSNYQKGGYDTCNQNSINPNTNN